MVKLLLQAAPQVMSVKGLCGKTPLEWALERVHTDVADIARLVPKEYDETTQLAASDPLIALLRAGVFSWWEEQADAHLKPPPPLNFRIKGRGARSNTAALIASSVLSCPRRLSAMK